MKKQIFLLFAAVIMTLCVTGCGSKHVTKNTKPSTSEAAEILLALDSYAIILPFEESTYDDPEISGFEEIMKEAGRECIVGRPENGSAAAQKKLVREMISRHVSGIAIAPVDADALSDILKEAMEDGIDVVTFDRPGDPKSRELYINPVGNAQLARSLMNTVLNLSDGAGQWAVLCESEADNRQYGWTESLFAVMKEDSFKNLEFTETAYGSADYRGLYDQTKALLMNNADLKVICATSPEALEAAYDAVTETDSDVLVTGIGDPILMKDKVSEHGNCRVFFYRNPSNVGKLAAYVSIALRGNQITGALDESFIAGNLGEYSVTSAIDGGTEVIIGSPVKIDAENIRLW